MQVEYRREAGKDDTLFGLLESVFASVVFVVPIQSLSRDVILRDKNSNQVGLQTNNWKTFDSTYFKRFINVSFALDAQLNIVECLSA